MSIQRNVKPLFCVRGVGMVWIGVVGWVERLGGGGWGVGC